MSLVAIDNMLDQLPEELSQCVRLEIFFLDKNKFATIPRCILKCRGLRIINLEDNNLSHVDEIVTGHHKSLEQLVLDKNLLTSLPQSICQDRSLQFLYVNNNRFTILPSTLGQCSKLTMLDVSNNTLTMLPECVDQLSALTTLRVNGNRLSTLPSSLGLYLFRSRSVRQRFDCFT